MWHHSAGRKTQTTSLLKNSLVLVPDILFFIGPERTSQKQGGGRYPTGWREQLTHQNRLIRSLIIYFYLFVLLKKIRAHLKSKTRTRSHKTLAIFVWTLQKLLILEINFLTASIKQITGLLTLKLSQNFNLQKGDTFGRSRPGLGKEGRGGKCQIS